MTATLMLRRPPRRRREALTNYRARLKLVKSGLPRLVLRRTTRYIIIQLVRSRYGGDECLLTLTSKELARFGWRSSFKSVPAAYLTGLLAGRRIVARGVDRAILDLGLQRRVHGSRLFAAAKGLVESGLELPCGEEVFPSDDRLRGEHIRAYWEQLSQAAERTQLSTADPDFHFHLPDKVQLVKRNIMEKGGAFE